MLLNGEFICKLSNIKLLNFITKQDSKILFICGMNRVLIKKLKEAINSSHPIDAINEIISEYEELIRLAEWRIEILESGKSLKRHEKELERISKMLEDSGYYDSITDSDIRKKVREYFRKL